MTEEEVRDLIASEIVKKLLVSIDYTGYEALGIKLLIEYDGMQVAYENL